MIDIHRPDTFKGMPVIVSPDIPKMQLSERVKEVLSPECIAETNAWMESFFGTTNIVPDGIAYECFGAIHMNPRTFNRLRSAVFN